MAKLFALFSRSKAIIFLTFCVLLLSIYIARRPRFSYFLSNKDGPNMNNTIDRPMVDWDQRRKHWLSNNDHSNRVMVVTDSQSSPCKSPTGDYLLLRLFKNKVDYCRLHRYEIFYNDAFIEDPMMNSFWAKIPFLKSAMFDNPGIEWLFWVDSNVVFTDMEFRVPFERYADHNMVVHDWNSSVFMIRNCQWSIDFLDVWEGMGPGSPDYGKWGDVLRSTLSDKLYLKSDDRLALAYLLLKGESQWRDKIYEENRYSLNGYWRDLVGKFYDIAKNYLDMEKKVKVLRRQHAEVVSEVYAAERESYMIEEGQYGNWRRPFVTHFTGCQPCSGSHNPTYEEGSCSVGMERALNFADNQVLRYYGFVHSDMDDGSDVIPLRFDDPRTPNDRYKN